MKSILLLFLFVSLFSFHCRKDYNAPDCINKKISNIKSQSKWNPPAEVHEYTYQGKKVYLFTSDCCDQYILLYDGSCNYICAPSGGITGKGDGKCMDFYSEAKYERLIWKDSR